MKNRKKLMADGMLLITAMIWGFGFFLQKRAAETTSAFCFNGFRYLIAAVVILIAARFRLPKGADCWKTVLPAGVILYAAGTLQQTGISMASIGNTSFITAMYTILVPFFSFLLLRRKISRRHILAAAVSLVGLYLLSTGGKGLEQITAGDMIVFAGSVFWALHILAVERGGTLCDPVQFCAGQFLVAGVLYVLTWLVFDHANPAGLDQSWPYAAISGIFVLGLAFTLQAIGQKNTGETEASIILGLESVFGAIFGVLLYGERFSGIEYLGMGLIFSAVLLAVSE